MNSWEHFKVAISVFFGIQLGCIIYLISIGSTTFAFTFFTMLNGLFAAGAICHYKQFKKSDYKNFWRYWEDYSREE